VRRGILYGSLKLEVATNKNLDMSIFFMYLSLLHSVDTTETSDNDEKGLFKSRLTLTNRAKFAIMQHPKIAHTAVSS